MTYRAPSGGRPLSKDLRPPSMPELKEDQVLSGEVLTGGIDTLQQQHAESERKRPASGVFSGAGDSGVWPGAGPAAGALAFITPLTLLFILVWYVTGAFTNSTSKQTLSLFKGDQKPFLSLTLMQHLSASICGTFAIRVLKMKQYKSLPSEAMTIGFYRLIFVYTLGFCLTNGSFGKVNASFVDTIKAGEPIATVLLTVVCVAPKRTARSSRRGHTLLVCWHNALWQRCACASLSGCDANKRWQRAASVHTAWRFFIDSTRLVSAS